MPLICLESLEILRDAMLRRRMPFCAPRITNGSAARRAASASDLFPAAIAASTLRIWVRTALRRRGINAETPTQTLTINAADKIRRQDSPDQKGCWSKANSFHCRGVKILKWRWDGCPANAVSDLDRLPVDRTANSKPAYPAFRPTVLSSGIHTRVIRSVKWIFKTS